MNSAPQEDLPFISGLLLEVLQKEQQSTQMVSYLPEVIWWTTLTFPIQRLPEEEAVIADLLKAAKNLAAKALKDSSYDERLKTVEECLKTSNFSSKILFVVVEKGSTDTM